MEEVHLWDQLAAGNREQGRAKASYWRGMREGSLPRYLSAIAFLVRLAEDLKEQHLVVEDDER